MLGEVTRDVSAASNHTTAPDVLQVFLRGQWTDLDGPAQEARIRKTAVAAGQHHE